MTDTPATGPAPTDPAPAGSTPAGPGAAPPRRAGAGRWSAVVGLSLLGAAGVGYLATLLPAFDDARPWVVAIAFAACTLMPIAALCWTLIIGPTIATDPHAEEGVESHWLDRAMGRAALDVMGTAGVAIIVLVATGWDFPAMWALTGVVALLMISTGVRYSVFSRREG